MFLMFSDVLGGLDRWSKLELNILRTRGRARRRFIGDHRDFYEV
jgi:hypothetical protein